MKITKNYSSTELMAFQKLVLERWPDAEFQKQQSSELTVPQPILVRNNNCIIGGLSYIRYPHPESGAIALWINTLLVVDAYQRQGIASNLIKSAMQDLITETELFVYSAIPSIYLKSGWVAVSQEGESCVLKFSKAK
ncbi:MAG TPA: GNAT family N-acetyltransferase [Cellvibrio sp.]